MVWLVSTIAVFMPRPAIGLVYHQIYRNASEKRWHSIARLLMTLLYFVEAVALLLVSIVDIDNYFSEKCISAVIKFRRARGAVRRVAGSIRVRHARAHGCGRRQRLAVSE